jgi:ribonuclease Y
MTTITMIVLLLFGLGLGYLLRHFWALARKNGAEMQANQLILQAKEDAQTITAKAQTKADEIEQAARLFQKEKELEIRESQERVIKREELLDKRALDLDEEFEKVQNQITEVRELKDVQQELVQKRTTEIERIAGLTMTEARDEMLLEVEKTYEQDIKDRMFKLERDGQDRLERRAADILATIIQRLATPTTSELTTTTITIPNEEIKGKIIGREGRNIRTFEKEAGVELIVDDTPGTITISGFDPVRRHVARVALENLIADGRIQPAKIEEFIQKAKDDSNKIIKEKGEAAAYEVGVYNLDPRVIAVLGRLHYRTSYGQNVLQHSIEMAHLAGMLAEELGADVLVAKAGALVHDIGKALDHEFPGTHIDIGIKVLEKFGADPRIVTAMKSHHDDCPHETVEAVIVQVCDMISGGRPGARRDTLENYIKRLSELENLATSFPGIDKAYALSAGREIRIFVNPQACDDVTLKRLAKDISHKIESELRYPGEIKVTMIREQRVIEYAR